MATTFTDLTLPRNGYATFDALTLKSLIRDRLTQGGVFTDQNFEGSNISAIMDVIALSYHYLLFYLNNTGAEAQFDQAALYENMNKLVKLMNYKPTGFQTGLLAFEATAGSDIPTGIYTLPRYSFFDVNGIYFSFPSDITFSKTLSGTEDLATLYEENLLKQGKWIEYPAQFATGENWETVTVVVKDTVTNNPLFIDGGFGVYVLDATTGKYNEYVPTSSLFLESGDALKYELRLNENEFYEIKFGNGVFGKKLNTNDQVYVYYLQSDGASGVISANQLNGQTINFFQSPQFNKISADVFSSTLNYISVNLATNISFSNNLASSSSREKETVDEIRVNSPKTFFSQNRLLTSDDFKTFISKNFSNIVIDVKAVNNNSFIENYIKYFYDLGLASPNGDPRFLSNEVNFAHAGQDNNVYIFAVPRIQSVDSSNTQYFLQNSQKNAIISTMNPLKALNMELVPQDPIYTAFTLGLAGSGETLTPDIAKTTFIVITKTSDARVDSNSIKNSVNTIFQNYFAPDNCTLGQLVSLSDLVSQILSVAGVANYSMRRILDDGLVINSSGLTLLVFNPNYSTDIQVKSTDIQLPYFKFPFLFNKTILDNIIVE
jgi:hypothetical protein